MLDIQFIRDNPELVAQKSQQKGYDVDITQLLGFDTERRELQQQADELRQQRNEIAASMKGGKPSDEHIAKGREVKERLADLDHKLAAIEDEFIRLHKQVPNMPAADVPVGATEDENVVIRPLVSQHNLISNPKLIGSLAKRVVGLTKSVLRK